jgi:hypothetical protein
VRELLGCACIAAGIALAAFLGYRVLVAESTTLSEWLLTAFVIVIGGGAVIGVGVGILRAPDRRRPDPRRRREDDLDRNPEMPLSVWRFGNISHDRAWRGHSQYWAALVACLFVVAVAVIGALLSDLF